MQAPGPLISSVPIFLALLIYLHSDPQIFPILNYRKNTIYMNGELLTAHITTHCKLHVGFDTTPDCVLVTIFL